MHPEPYSPAVRWLIHEQNAQFLTRGLLGLGLFLVVAIIAFYAARGD